MIISLDLLVFKRRLLLAEEENRLRSSSGSCLPKNCLRPSPGSCLPKKRTVYGRRLAVACRRRETSSVVVWQLLAEEENFRRSLDSGRTDIACVSSLNKRS